MLKGSITGRRQSVYCRFKQQAILETSSGKYNPLHLTFSRHANDGLGKSRMEAPRNSAHILAPPCINHEGIEGRTPINLDKRNGVCTLRVPKDRVSG